MLPWSARTSKRSRRLGHRLKGTLLYLAVEPATAAASTVERCGTSGSQAATEEAVKTLEHEVDRLKRAVADYRPGNVGGGA